jgi:hypothetical protein
MPGAEHALRGPQIERGESRAAEVIGRSEADDADDLEALGRSFEQHGQHVADRDAVVGCGARVDRHLARSHRPASGAHRQHLELLVAGDRHAQRRRPGESDRLAVLADDLRETVDAAFHGCHAFHASHARKQAFGHEAPVVAARDEVCLRAHDDIGARGDLVEQLVEGGVHRVGEHVGAGDETDAEHDRQGRERQAELVREEAAEHRLPHR